MFLTAARIHDGYKFLPAGTVVEVADDGTILALHDSLLHEEVIAHDGILCPGFVNVHCHLELSHLKDMLPERTGLIPFLQKIPIYRTEFTDEQIKAARHEAYQELLSNGIVAVGDIANVTDTMDLRLLNKLHMHNFVECIGFTESHALHRYEEAVQVYEHFRSQPAEGKMLRQSVVPHAPYSVSPSLFKLIDKHHPQSIISIHNQEATAEDQYYREKQGTVRDLLRGFGIDDCFFEASGKSSLQTYTEWLSAHHTMIFVHNTYTSDEDIRVAQFRFENTYWCLCPNANIYIEGTLPDVAMLQRVGAQICIGTDSLASNHQLCILSELNTLKQNMPDLDWEVLLRWGTLNGALALNMQHIVGSLEQGKQPGILNIRNLENGMPDVHRIL